MSATKDHGQRAEDLLGQVSVTADKALEAATVHAILHLADQVAALGRERPVYLERLADGWVETGGPAAAGFMPHPDAEPADYAEQQGLRPHSRACGFRSHPHGPECHPNCPTCGGGVAARNAAMTEALRDPTT